METEVTGDQRKNRDHPDNSSVMVNYNTYESLGDLRRLGQPEIRERIETIQITALLWSTTIFRRVLEI